ncbi:MULTISPECIES: hypothetical protein [unclassified Mesorhizobium]|nr:MULTISPECIES: hypothetical protein [unclassified Mesorhizobium]MBZ9982722.1 hypothetical protein [Mesorhizobium sp. BR-1-1-8]
MDDKKNGSNLRQIDSKTLRFEFASNLKKILGQPASRPLRLCANIPPTKEVMLMDA